jgi:excinuclease UvrABC nuclease subunit
LEIPLVYDQADKLLIKLRDESHRFANRYREQQMKIKDTRKKDRDS